MNIEPNSLQNTQPMPPVGEQPTVIESTVEKTYTVGERAIKAGQLAGWNLCTVGLVNLNLFREDSWLRKEYQAVWYGRTVEVVKSEVVEESPEEEISLDEPSFDEPQEERRLVRAGSRNVAAVKSDDDNLTVQKNERRPIIEVGSTFELVGPNGVKGRLEILDLEQTVYHPALEGASSLPQLEDGSNESSNVLTRIWNSAGRVLSKRTGSDLAPVSQKISSTMKFTLPNGMETTFRVNIFGKAESFTSQMMQSLVNNMFGTVEGSPRQMSAVAPTQEPLMLQGRAPIAEKPLMLEDAPRFSMLENGAPLVSRKLTITDKVQPIRVTIEELPKEGSFTPIPRSLSFELPEERIQEIETSVEKPRVTPRSDTHSKAKTIRNIAMFWQFFTLWSAMRARGSDMGARQFTPQPSAQNQPWYSRLYSLFTRAVSYIGQSIKSNTPQAWWKTATPIHTQHMQYGDVEIVVDLLGMNTPSGSNRFEQID